jgi:hypothetical protein
MHIASLSGVAANGLATGALTAVLLMAVLPIAAAAPPSDRGDALSFSR